MATLVAKPNNPGSSMYAESYATNTDAARSRHDRYRSGHPAPGQSLPPNLGLIESRDGGRTWKGVSLLGQADFHVLQSAGRRVYGFDGTQGRLMVSSNDGRSWTQRTPPAGIFALAIDPRRPDDIVASTERGLFASPNAGRGWRPMRNPRRRAAPRPCRRSWTDDS